ncbi:TPA: LysR family transcriptional regulator [Streptococcus suis]
MDIVQMGYLINIVECRCNLSLAAKKIHISQSALSQFITHFEASEGIQLFNRKNGRLDGLTEAGRMVYRFATEIIARYEEMQDFIQKEAAKQQGTIRLGVPSVILRAYFSQLLPTFYINYPNINIEIFEGGGLDLWKKFMDNDLNIALLIEPTNLDDKKYEQHLIHKDEYIALMDKDHPLAGKEWIEWTDLQSYPMTTFNQNFTSYSNITQKLKDENVTIERLHLSSSWDYLVAATAGNDIISILPSSIEELIDESQFTVVRFRDTLPFNIWLCRPYRKRVGEAENFIYEEIRKFYRLPVEEE